MLRNAKRMGAEGGKNDKMMLIGLGVVIVVALAGLVYSMVGGGSDMLKAPAEIYFHCVNSKCGNEWPISSDEMANSYDPTKVVNGAYCPDCPKCGAKLGGREMTKCPICNQWYFGSKKNESGDQMCPKCSGNISEYLREWAAKQS